jgi:hypothetical protein
LGNLLWQGVIDPVKVVRAALQNAASVASLVLSTECPVAERSKEDKAGGAGATRVTVTATSDQQRLRRVEGLAGTVGRGTPTLGTGATR